ncbi:rho GTPase-activating protein 24-like [Osmerus eperlanus]|uniref:rho GTPase-activating protein 24-like n=1 Tax=Osmerus eperlanus TaxID=29151 RepID=UPI002E1186C8
MELHCLPTETPTTTTSSCSTPPRHYCPALAQRGGRRERRGLCPAGSKPPDPSLAGRTPAGAVVPTLGWGAGGGPGLHPDYHGLGVNTAERGREREEGGEEERQGSADISWEENQSALSVYDNLVAVTPVQDTSLEAVDMETSATPAIGFPDVQVSALLDDGAVSEASSSWSSCEILLAGSSASNRPNQDQDQDQDLDQDLDLDQDPVAPVHPSPPVTLGMPPPLPLADPSASALRSLLTSLHQQIGRQREDYEARIHSLEQRNEALLGEVQGLKANLFQQQSWYRAVQSRIDECERARGAAEQRNRELQREMEQFLDTFGELNHEAKKTESIVRGF